VNFYWITGINPEPWAIGTPYRRGSKGLGISPNGKLKAYQQAIREEFPLQNGHAAVQSGDLSIQFYFWRSSAHGNVADATNLQKATEDALQGLLYDNDRSNLQVGSVIMQQTPATDPHILITVCEFVRPVIEVPEIVTIPRWADPTWIPPEQDLF
jgi:Holliday junction resolvase RusA-like endonuclease